MTKIKGFNPLERFRGDDPGRILRIGAQHMLDTAIANGERRERAKLVHQYTTRECLEVEVVQLRIDPPLWQMRTCQPIIAEHGILSVQEAERRHLEPELRIMAARTLFRHGYAKTFEEAREKTATMEIRERGLILLPDSERFLGERRK